MTSDKNQPGYGSWMPQWGGDPSGQPQQGPSGPHDTPPHWGHHRGQGEDGPRHRGPWGHPDHRDRQGPRSHGKHDHHGPQNAPQYGWRSHGAPEQQWDPRGPEQQWDPRGPSGWGQDGSQEGRGHRWGGCGGRWRHGDQQQETHSHGPSWTGVALTGAGVFGLYKLFQGRRH